MSATSKGAGLLPDTMLSAELKHWLATSADSLDCGNEHAGEVMPALARAGLFRIGVPARLGGSGGDVRDAVSAIAAVGEHSVTAAFVLWAQRSFIEYVLQSPNEALRSGLASLLDGGQAGASGLSNAMKFLSGIESLQIAAQAQAADQGAAGRWRLDGRMPWVTNLRRPSFVVAAAVSREDGPAMVVALPGDRPGMRRSEDLNLLGLRGSNTAAIGVEGVEIGEADVIHPDARAFLPRVRPAFLGLQCGMSIGLARASIAAARAFCGAGPSVLHEPIASLDASLEQTVDQLYAGLADDSFVRHAAALFRLRIRLAQIAQSAAELELQGSGGRAYLLDIKLGFPRRWREAAFVPIITPSLTQLQTELQKQAHSSVTAK